MKTKNIRITNKSLFNELFVLKNKKEFKSLEMTLRFLIDFFNLYEKSVNKIPIIKMNKTNINRGKK